MALCMCGPTFPRQHPIQHVLHIFPKHFKAKNYKKHQRLRKKLRPSLENLEIISFWKLPIQVKKYAVASQMRYADQATTICIVKKVGNYVESFRSSMVLVWNAGKKICVRMWLHDTEQKMFEKPFIWEFDFSARFQYLTAHISVYEMQDTWWDQQQATTLSTVLFTLRVVYRN